MGAGTQKSGGAAALPAPPPPRSLVIIKCKDLLALNQRFNQEEPFLFKSVMGNSQVKQVTAVLRMNTTVD